MKIVILDGFAANPGDLDWSWLKAYGDLTVYDRTPEALVVERARDAQIVILNKTPVSRETLAQLPEVKLIAVLATGYNIVDVDACWERGVLVANIPSYSVSAVAQQVFAFILEFANRVGLHTASVTAGEWAANPDFSYQKAPTAELLGKTIGIIGYGRIGRRVAALAKAFEMRVLVNTAHPEKYPDADVRFLPLDELLPQCDFVTVHCPQTAETDRFVNADFLAKMKDGAFLVNTSRGGEVDEQALADALNSGKLAGAGVDVLSTEPPRADNPLLSAKNIFITPHIAWASYETRVRLMGILKENIRGFMEGKPVNVVNMG
ncbi:MAG: D-2-hydroxyacid dehydrogenase [Clostridia bacterium]|nr:D-2-hydroxyacid dehydrogenase [Clostridia bacterium]